MKSKNNSNNRPPRAKGTDTAAVYMPKEGAKKVKQIVFHPENRRIVEEFITILDIHRQQLNVLPGHLHRGMT